MRRLTRQEGHEDGQVRVRVLVRVRFRVRVGVSWGVHLAPQALGGVYRRRRLHPNACNRLVFTWALLAQELGVHRVHGEIKLEPTLGQARG